VRCGRQLDFAAIANGFGWDLSVEPIRKSSLEFNWMNEERTMKINQFLFAAIATLPAGGLAFAQKPGDAQKPAGEKTSQLVAGQNPKGGVTQTNEQILATCLAIANREQVQFARFAKDKLTHDDVKKFAAMLETEHQGCLEKLEGISPQVTSPRSTTATTRSNNVAGSETPIDFLQLHQEMSDQCLKDSKEALTAKQGAQLDKCFVMMQLAKHAGMKSSLTVLQRHSQGKMQGMIEESLETTTKHMKAAEKLMEQLEDVASSTGSRASK
jgi:predicted outer membrane protein